MEKYHQGVHGRAGLRPFKAAFSWQLYKVTPLTEHDNPNAVCESGLNEEVEGLAGTLFNEIANLDNEIWQKVYAGKDTVTHKALSPLKTLHQKLCGLTFVEPHVAPVASLIQTAINSIPAKGNITGKELILLQGVVSMFRDPSSMLQHSQRLIEGHSPQDVMNALLANDVFTVCQQSAIPTEVPLCPSRKTIPQISPTSDCGEPCSGPKTSCPVCLCWPVFWESNTTSPW